MLLSLSFHYFSCSSRPNWVQTILPVGCFVVFLFFFGKEIELLYNCVFTLEDALSVWMNLGKLARVDVSRNAFSAKNIYFDADIAVKNKSNVV